MPDFGKLEQDAKDHSQQIDEGLQAADKEADKEAGGADKGLIDKAAAGAENEVGGQPPGPDPSAGQSDDPNVAAPPNQ